MSIQVSYPRVTISTKALRHARIVPEAEDTTNLFIPLFTPKGPSQVVTRIHSLDEFIDVFGDLGELEYKKNGQTALNLYNWLSNGGTAYVYRLNGITCKKESTANGSTTTEKLVPLSKKGEILCDGNVDLKTVTITITRTQDQPTGETTGDQTEETTPTYTYVTTYTLDGVTSDLAASGYTLVEAINPATIDASAWNDNVYTKANVKIRKITCDSKHGSAKYYGTFYNNFYIRLSYVGKSSTDKAIFNVSIYYVKNGNKITLDEYYRLTIDTYKKAMSGNEYFENINFDSIINGLSNDNKTEIFSVAGAEDNDIDLDEILADFWTDNDEGISKEENGAEVTYYLSEKASSVLGSRLQTPVDIVLDAGYSAETKTAINNFIANDDEETAIRPDIIGIFDAYVLNSDLDKAPQEAILKDDFKKATNIALYQQFFTEYDAIFNDRDIYVTPTFFLSSLIARNDLQYGVQWPTAGIRRGVLEGAKVANINPSPLQKDAWFKDRVNYAEVTPREISFQSQRTYDGSSDDDYTALSFLNNARTLEKIKKELERLGREYLFEFNDSLTLSQMSNVLNKYITQWISNRTLASANVTVTKNQYSAEAVDINLVIKFTDTIENIYVSITIE